MNTTTPSKCKIVLDWLDARTGVCSALQRCESRRVAGCSWLNHLWPSLIVFLFVVQVLTGLVLWLHYSPSATSAWESVYYVQHEVAGGWLVRGVHYFAAQVMVALTVLYVIQLVVLGSYRRPREFVFWAALGLALAALGMCLTGDLLRWDQNGFSATKTRVSFLMLLPNIGVERLVRVQQRDSTEPLYEKTPKLKVPISIYDVLRFWSGVRRRIKTE